MGDTRARPLAALLAGAAALAAAAPAGAGAGIALERSISLPVDAARATRSVGFRLPEGSLQGRTGWYLIRLRVRVAFAPGGGEGNAYVSAATNGRTAAQIRFRARPGRPITWDAVGIVDGTQRGVVRNGAVTVAFRNYLQDSGVHGGRNVLSFTFERLGEPGVRSVEVLPGSGVVRTRAAPGRVLLDFDAPAVEPAPGRTLPLAVRVTNHGGRSSRVEQVFVAAGEGVRAIFERHEPFVLRAGETRRLRLFLRAARPGRYALQLTARTSSNHPGSSGWVRFEGGGSAVPGFGLLAGGLLGAALGVAALGIARATGRSAGRAGSPTLPR